MHALNAPAAAHARSCAPISPGRRTAPRLMTRADAQDFAWALANAAFPAIPRRQRSWLSVALGTGDDQQEAIEELLRLVADHQVPLPPELTDIALDWVRGYVGTAHEARLRVLISQAMSIAP